MNYVNLGRAGVKVSRICLGTAFRASLFKASFDETACIRTIARALDLGINFIDTANYYSYGRSEELVGKAIRHKRDEVVLATKVRSPVKENPGPNDVGLSRYHILREVERSLTRLQTDHIDVYWLHAVDDATPIEETLRAMDDLVRAGKVRYIGCCNFAAWQVCEGLWRSEALHLNAFAAIQNQYSLLNRWEVEPELMAVCNKYGLGITAYSPLAIGLLTGRFRFGQLAPPGTPWADNPFHAKHFGEMMTPREDAIVQKLIGIGHAQNKTPAQVALAWILDHPEITSVIIGPDAPEHVDEVMGGLGWTLAPEDRASLDELSKVKRPIKVA